MVREFHGDLPMTQLHGLRGGGKWTGRFGQEALAFLNPPFVATIRPVGAAHRLAAVIIGLPEAASCW
jgi:hypothetical protein